MQGGSSGVASRSLVIALAPCSSQHPLPSPPLPNFVSSAISFMLRCISFSRSSTLHNDDITVQNSAFIFLCSSLNQQVNSQHSARYLRRSPRESYPSSQSLPSPSHSHSPPSYSPSHSRAYSAASSQHYFPRIFPCSAQSTPPKSK